MENEPHFWRPVVKIGVWAAIIVIAVTMAMLAIKNYDLPPTVVLTQSEFLDKFQANDIAHAKINIGGQAALTPVTGTYFKNDKDGKVTKEEVPFTVPNAFFTEKMLDALLVSGKVEVGSSNTSREMIIWSIAPFLILGILGIGTMLLLSFIFVFIIRRVWRATQLPSGDASVPPTSNPKRVNKKTVWLLGVCWSTVLLIGVFQLWNKHKLDAGIKASEQSPAAPEGNTTLLATQPLVVAKTNPVSNSRDIEPDDLREAQTKLAELRVDYADNSLIVQRQLARIKELERLLKEEPGIPADLRAAKADLAVSRVDYSDNSLVVQRLLARIKELERLSKEEPGIPADLRMAKTDLAASRVDYPDNNLVVQRLLARIAALEKIGHDQPDASVELRTAVAQRAELLVDYPPQNLHVQEVDAEIKALEQSSVGPQGDNLVLAVQPPVVVETLPVSGAREIEPGETEIHVRFSQPMMNGSWSWSTAWEDSTPEFIGDPHYDNDGRTCVVKVKLEAGKTYAFWLNSDKFSNFKDNAGRPAVPYLLIFSTKQK